MIVHQPETIGREGKTVVFSKIELRKPQAGFPEYVWYRIPDQYIDFISIQSDAFLVSSILPAMIFWEDIEVKGTVSPQLVYHLEEYQFILNMEFPNDLHKVEIRCDSIQPLKNNPEGVGAAFSGGVDSLFTLWKHMPANQIIPEYRITHCLLVLGYNISHRRAEYFKRLFTHFQDSLKEINVELIPLETNLVNTIIPRNNFIYFSSPVLASFAHLLGRLFRRFFISSSLDYHALKNYKDGSTSLTDSMFSTETLDIIHYGATYARAQKVQEISNWEFAHNNLKVCFQPDTFWNCSRCEKCVRTMIPLYALDRLEKFETFEQPLKNDRDILRWWRGFTPYLGYADEMFVFAKLNKPKILPWIRSAAYLGYIRYWLNRLIPGFIKRLLYRWGVFVNPFMSKEAFENAEVINLIKS